MNASDRISVEPAPAKEAVNSLSHELSISDAIAFVRYYWPLVAATAGAAFVLAALFVGMARSTYTSTAQLLIETTSQSAPTLAMSESVVALDTPQIESEIALLSSEQIIGKAVEILHKAADGGSRAPASAGSKTSPAPAKPQKAGNPADAKAPDAKAALEESSWLYRLIFGEPAKETQVEKDARIKGEISEIQQGLDVKRMGLSYVLVLSYKSTDPQQAAAVVNALGDAYVQDKIDRRRDTARQSGLWLESRIEEIRHLMNEAALDVQAFKARRDYRINERPEGIDKDGTYGFGSELSNLPNSKAPAGAKNNTQTTPQEAPTLDELDSRALTYRKIYESYLQAYTDTVQRESYPSTSSRVIARGEVPTSRSGPRRTLTLVGSLVLGSLMGFALALVHFSFDHTVRSARQIWENLRVPLLGDVDQIAALKHFSFTKLLGWRPRISSRSNAARPVVHFSPTSRTAMQLAESALSVQAAAKSYGIKVIGFVDTQSGATSATMCANIALLNAKAGKRTLLVETDPQIEGVPLAGAGTRSNLIDVMNGTVAVESAALPSKFDPNLFLLNIGKEADQGFWTPETIDTLGRLLEHSKRYYDAIFVHLLPIKANHASLAVEGVVIVATKHDTSMADLVDAATLLRIAEKPILGVIISGLA